MSATSNANVRTCICGMEYDRRYEGPCHVPLADHRDGEIARQHEAEEADADSFRRHETERADGEALVMMEMDDAFNRVVRERDALLAAAHEALEVVNAVNSGRAAGMATYRVAESLRNAIRGVRDGTPV